MLPLTSHLIWVLLGFDWLTFLVQCIAMVLLFWWIRQNIINYYSEKCLGRALSWSHFDYQNDYCQWLIIHDQWSMISDSDICGLRLSSEYKLAFPPFSSGCSPQSAMAYFKSGYGVRGKHRNHYFDSSQVNGLHLPMTTMDAASLHHSMGYPTDPYLSGPPNRKQVCLC